MRELARIYFLFAMSLQLGMNAAYGEPVVIDTPFWQEVAVVHKPEINLADLELRNIRADRDGRVLVSTNKGLLKATDGRLVTDRSMAALDGLDHFDLEVLRGKFVYLTNRFFLPVHGAGVDYFNNENDLAHRCATTGPGRFVLLSDKNIIEMKDGKVSHYPQGETPFTEIKADEATGEIVLWSANQLARFVSGGKLEPMAVPPAPITAVAFDGPATFLCGTSEGLYSIDKSGATKWAKPIPVESITSVARDPLRGWLWVGTTDGLFRQDDKGTNSYYEGKRWLPDNHVIDFTVDQEGDVWVLTKGGVVRLDFKKMTLEEKAGIFLANLRKHHVRFGLVADAQTPGGDYAAIRMHDSDNDGLWSSMYLAGEVFRYGVTKQQDALDDLMDGLDALERLVTITRIPGFQARSFEIDGFRVSDPDAWRKRPEKDFEWKGTTSSDELAGTIFFYSVLYDTLAKDKPELRKRVADLVGAIVGHIVDHDWYYVDSDGKPTRWGYWHPANINTPTALHDRRLNSIEILAFLQLAYHLTKDEKFKTGYDELVDKHGYAENTINYFPDPLGPWNHSDDELYWLSYHVLLSYPIRDSLTPKFVQSATEQLEANLRKRNPLWNVIYAARTGKSIDAEGIGFWLREFPIDRRTWRTRNSHRKDIAIERRLFVPPEAKPVLPPDERYVHKWNTNEMTLDGGGNGDSAESGAEFLLPYWMGRYYDLISAPK